MGPQYIFSINVNNTEIDVILFLDPTKVFYAQSHTHSGYEFHYIRDGSAKLSIGNESHNLEPDGCYLISKGSFHKIDMISEKITRLGALITFHNENATAYNPLEKLPPFTEIPIQKNLANSLTLLLDNLLDKKVDSSFEEYTKAAFTLVFIDLFRSLSLETFANKSSNSDEYLPHLSDEAKKDKILQYFHNNLATANLDDLSKIVHLGKRQLERFLKDKMGENFSSFYKKYRIEHAKSLIISNKNSLEEIAFLSGYNSYKGFYLAFQSYTGMNPQAFKEDILSRQK